MKMTPLGFGLVTGLLIVWYLYQLIYKTIESGDGNHPNNMQTIPEYLQLSETLWAESHMMDIMHLPRSSCLIVQIVPDPVKEKKKV